MIKKFLLPVLAIFTLLLVSGCNSRDAGPNPGDTNWMGDGGAEGDWLDGDVYIGEGLEARDIDMMDPSGMQPSTKFPEGVIESVYFGFDQYSITPAERPKVAAAAEYLEANPSARLVAEGHTDWYGTEEYNLGLSDRRSSAVKDYLAALGIDPMRVEILAMGEQDAEQGLAKTDPSAISDRRVDMIIME